MKNSYEALIESDRVSPQTRAVMMARLKPAPLSETPSILTPELASTLRALVSRVIPQSVEHGDDIGNLDLAAKIDKKLASDKGDGWRYATLPPDSEACRIGLMLLNEYAQGLSGVPFDELTPSGQDALLDSIASRRRHSPKLDLVRWFEDMRAHATEIFVAHPQTLARMGYSGIADDRNGFVLLGIGKVEDWEPQPR